MYLTHTQVFSWFLRPALKSSQASKVLEEEMVLVYELSKEAPKDNPFDNSAVDDNSTYKSRQARFWTSPGRHELEGPFFLCVL